MKKWIAIFFFTFIPTAFASTAPRYISLAPSTTEILYALGLGDDVVGVSSFCNYPPEAKKKTRVGDFNHPNMEKIYTLRPDHVFCTGLVQAPIIRECEKLGIPIYVQDPTTLDGLYQTIEDIGTITHKEKEAQALIDKMKTEIAQISNRVRIIPKDEHIKVFVEIWHDPLMTIGAGSFVDELVTLAGGVNIATDIRGSYGLYSAERVIQHNPGCIIMTYMDKKPALGTIAHRLSWGNIAAVKNRRVFNDIDPDLLLRPGPRVTEGIRELHKRLYS
jgi:iron complex transport system substrate-binding protein